MTDGTVPLIPLGTTIAHAAQDKEQPHSRWPATTQHVVRIGPNYKKNGKKAPSLAALYETIGVELFTHDSCVVDAASQLQLPPPACDPEPGLNQGPLPRIIVVNFSLPLESAQMWNPPRDGQNCSLVLIFRVKPETQRAARDAGTAPPAVQLLVRYCSEAPTSRPLQERFKLIGVVDNMERLGLPSLVQSYNGKPMLVTKSGTLTHRQHCDGYGLLEMDCNVHYFGYPARKGLSELKGRVKEMVLNIAVVVQAETDDEMPEQVLGCVLVRAPETADGCSCSS